ncbi:MAG: DNA-binding protein [Candidatus Aenigmarchaeota archaeon]|nr:DNA-binding protein [Candidatus Aenigmarchaeota archaeon]
MNEEELRKLQEFEMLKESILKKILTKEAKERLSRVKLVKPELASQIELYLVQLYQAGQIKSMVTEAQIKNILSSLATKKKFKIIR